MVRKLEIQGGGKTGEQTFRQLARAQGQL